MAQRKRRRVVFWMISALLAAAVMVVPRIAARMQVSREIDRLVVRAKSDGSAPELLFVFLRRAERRSAEDPAPHRNSLFALYKRSSEDHFRYARVTPTWHARTTSTSGEFPSQSDFEQIKGVKDSYSRRVEYGYTSIPDGVYTIQPVGKSDRYPTGAFQLSDPGAGGRVQLPEPQTIHRISRNESGELAPGEVVRSSSEKGQVFFHGTPTHNWSFFDSDGCINLCDDPDSEVDDWGDFLRNWQSVYSDGMSARAVITSAVPGSREDSLPDLVLLGSGTDGAGGGAALILDAAEEGSK